MRPFDLPGRSTVHAANGMAATSHPLATLAAIEMLRRGGNAVDAAVTASAVLCVVEPGSTGIGGDCFALYAPGGNGLVIALNGSGRAPAAADAAYYADYGITTIDPSSAHAVTVPGAVDAWSRLLEDHGTRGLGEVLAPAIEFAAEGYVIAPRVASDWERSAPRLAGDENATRIFMPGGESPRVGDIHRQPELAVSLRAIAKRGRAEFYEGAVAEDVVAYLRAKGGLHTLDDFAEHTSEYVEPIAANYRGLDIVECPPNGQGLAALVMLNILSGFDLARLDPHGAKRFHLEAEAKRLAFRVRNSLIADPAKAKVPVAEVLSSGYADALRREIDGSKAMHMDALDQVPVHPDTIFLTVVDSDRNTISFINSVFSTFGSTLVAPKSGVMLHNRGTGFVLTPGHPNCIAPRKRPLHTIIPGLAMREGRAVMPFGVMGGHFQPTGHAHLVTNVVDYGMDPQEALDSPRVFHHEGVLAVESGVREEVAAELAAMGHTVVRGGPHGGGQAIWIDWQRGTLTGASDPRKDGCALGY
jgi:gamma-glutamyltranspeptidase/glutathione hydrolase